MIHPLTRANEEALCALETRARSGVSARTLKEALESDTQEVLGYHDGTVLTGYALVTRLPFEAELQAIGVLPERRGEGMGRALLQAVIVQARAWQSERVLLEVRAGNLAAITLYERLGFGIDGRRKGYYPAIEAAGREDALLMSRGL
ncbi:ribosomal protein S18-alanine N-acetyltransferase [Vreelandella malpeensis]|uniref:[Ribosomal protein bS18]-alanine N-acetyltransferase n=1 Tax=Vreelandella malpeensis TaxID=1172368 RepID=A0ABS8DXM2_9GAMM|nr:ribosomal protein S18-alanine N-acetyltransferase [Halomonas malpeensis]MCB8890510.1 ribosomal protein S18-alanine N-acetyltransferase [Halomonas malpeensis]